jgi:hypothetical protein
MRLRLIAVPYDSARRGWRMGRGPLHLLEAAIARLGDVRHQVIEADEPRLEVRTAFELCKRVAAAARAARDRHGGPGPVLHDTGEPPRPGALARALRGGEGRSPREPRREQTGAAPSERALEEGQDTASILQSRLAVQVRAAECIGPGLL